MNSIKIAVSNDGLEADSKRKRRQNNQPSANYMREHLHPMGSREILTVVSDRNLGSRDSLEIPAIRKERNFIRSLYDSGCA